MKSNKKIAILLGDGMADYPIPELGGKTPLEAAYTPNMDYIASNGLFGLAKTVPDGMTPGSDTANLSIFGYNPQLYYTGRAPLEALNMNIKMNANDVAFRCNIVSIENNIMKDFSAGHIESAYSAIIIDELKKHIKHKDIEFYAGVSYRNIIIWRNYPYKEIPGAAPPHDIQDKPIDNYLPRGDGADVLLEIMRVSQSVIKNSDIIQKAGKTHKGKPASAWLWGGGKKPAIDTLEKRFGLTGYTISAVDLIHGIGRAAGLEPMHVDGTTGYIDTNYCGKADALKLALDKSNFVFLHVESPDESGHEGNLEHKIQAIQDFDEKIVGRALDYLKEYDDLSVLIMPDHPTPISIRTHSSEPVPFTLYGTKTDYKYLNNLKKASCGFNERDALQTGFVIDAHNLIELILKK